MASERDASAAPYELVGELFEERGELAEALRWFDLAASRLTDEELRAIGRNPFGQAILTLEGRSRVRRALGQAPDDLNRLAAEADSAHRAQLAQALETADRPDATRVSTARIAFWPRAEMLRAHQRWPALVGDSDVDAYVEQRELGNRELAGSGLSVQMVPFNVDELASYAERHGHDPVADTTRQAFTDELHSKGRAVTWPPPRNAPCWCGSGRKYKHCCLRISES